jgi:hypothetical protein
MKKSKKYGFETYIYPLDKARKLLEEDGTLLTEDELKQLVSVLTLLAQKEAELLNPKIENE